MTFVRWILGLYLLAVSVATAINWVTTPLYHDGSTNYWLWAIMNWFLAAAVVITLAVNSLRKYQLCKSEPAGGGITREYLEVNLAFAFTLLLALWYFWNWFGSLYPANEPEVVGLIHLEWWAFINPLGVLVYGYTGAHLLRAAVRGGRS